MNKIKCIEPMKWNEIHRKNIQTPLRFRKAKEFDYQVINPLLALSYITSTILFSGLIMIIIVFLTFLNYLHHHFLTLTLSYIFVDLPSSTQRSTNCK